MIKRGFINTLVVRDGSSGKWSFNFDQCEIVATQDRYNDDYNKDNLMSVPYGRAKTICGAQDSLEQTIADGEAKVVAKDGVKEQTFKRGNKDSLNGVGKKTSATMSSTICAFA